MKKANILKSFSDLPPVTAQVSDAASLTNPESSRPASGPASDDFRETLRRRATAAIAAIVPYHRWGLNE